MVIFWAEEDEEDEKQRDDDLENLAERTADIYSNGPCSETVVVNQGCPRTVMLLWLHGRYKR